MGGQPAIGHQRRRRDFQQGFPDRDLEIRAAQQEMQLSRRRRGGEDPLRQCAGAGIVAHQTRRRPILAQDIQLCRVVIVTKCQITNAARRPAEQGVAQRCGGEAVAQFDAGAMRANLARRHGFAAHHQVVQAAGPGEAGVQRRVEHIGRRTQCRARMLLGQVLQEALGRKPGPGREEPLQVVFAQLRRRRDFGQFRLARGVGADEGDGPRHCDVLPMPIAAVFQRGRFRHWRLPCAGPACVAKSR